MPPELSSTQTFSKVAEVTICFWIMKILATTLRETAGDFISMMLGLGYYWPGFNIPIPAIVLSIHIGATHHYPLLF